MATEGSRRKHLFRPGAKYRVLKDWSFFGSTFVVGSTLEYESCGYELHDEATLFRFYPISDKSPGTSLVWWLRDDEPESKAREYFAEI
jgi:hypothetical protein